MSQQDLTSDMLTRLRNAVRNHAKDVKCLNNKLNRGVLQVLVDEGYIGSFDVVDDGHGGFIKVGLKYGPRGETLINSIRRASKPGCRRYSGVEGLPRPIQGLGIAVVSTSRGVMSDRKCRTERVGGEVVAIVT
jgi:small subunit ribosomal protein S8